MITALAIEGYRSLRRLVLPLAPLNVVTGPNGSGKSSLYRALRLLADASRNGAVAALAREGGLPSTLWAGPAVIGRAVRRGEHPVQPTARTGPVCLRLGFAGDEFGYAVDFGLPVGGGMFGLDPEIKREAIWTGPVLRPATLLSERHNSQVRLREDDGGWYAVPRMLPTYDSMLSEVADLDRAPELVSVREHLRSWRFYDHFRTDARAPARAAQIGTRTPALGHDGADLAAALQTIVEIGSATALAEAVDGAFPGSRLGVDNRDGRFTLTLSQPGLLRPLGSAELSDGTLRYLLLVAALLTPRPPTLLVLNEPETSLHPDLLPPLGRLIARAASSTQLVVVSHAQALIRAIADEAAPERLQVLALTKDTGETRLIGQQPLDEPPWRWPER